MANQILKYSLMIVTVLGTVLSVEGRSVDPLYDVEKILPDNNLEIIVNGKRRPFPDVLDKMDQVLKRKSDPCDSGWYNSLKPKYENLRISERKCLDYIWHLKTTEETENRMKLCNQNLKGITHGFTPELGEYRHMGAVGWKGKNKGEWEFKCGSFLISKRHALTAAHCRIDENKNEPRIVRFGVINISNKNTDTNRRGLDIHIKTITPHEDYTHMSDNYDIAVIKLKKKVPFSFIIYPACILSQYDLVNKAIISGWGSLSRKSNKISENMQAAEVNVLTYEDCKMWKKKRNDIKLETLVCTNGTHGDRVADICGGDSGGPLQTKLQINTKSSIYNVIGITSFNDECQSKKFPSLFTKVSSYIDWIEEKVWGAEMNKTKNEDKNIAAIDAKGQSENQPTPDSNSIPTHESEWNIKDIFVDESEIARNPKFWDIFASKISVRKENVLDYPYISAI